MARRLKIEGTVQGVGFRPLVYRVATQLGLAGRVRNTAGAVVVDLVGPAEQVHRFEPELRRQVSPPATIERLSSAELPPGGEPIAADRFIIEPSEDDGVVALSLAADCATCPACLAELDDPGDRRHGYPLTNCTSCGPRYTITRALPYDRPNTTMAPFEMCADCAAEYHDPGDRRFHAQPVACPACGPAIVLERGDERHQGHVALTRAREMLAGGAVLAVKGLGGFHLAANARDARAVARVRLAKQRERKPLAVMVANVELARRVVALDEETEALLCSPAAPIVLAPATRDRGGLADGLAPGLGDLGVMLPYTPLHHLLLAGDPREGAALDALVMTSGNAAAEPITTDNQRARQSLDADGYLLHERAIEVACDDSVARAGGSRGPVMIRRARGYVPGPLDGSFLPDERVVVALGAELKVTVSTLAGGQLSVGRHLGNLDNPASEAAFVAEIDRMLSFGRLEPELVAVDLHPDAFGAQHAARRFAGLPLIRVQHHHAHLAAVLAEHGVAPGVVAAGVILDGLGFGEDETIWGGEVLRGGYASAERTGHLRPIPQPGGDHAAREPWRMALSLLQDAGLAERAAELLPGRQANDLEALAAACGVRQVSPLTSSAGRLFDGFAALLGVAPHRQEYEGEAAALLEALAEEGHEESYPLPRSGDDGCLDTRQLTHALLDDLAGPARRAARLINALADALAEVALAAGCEIVVLGGGCFVNRPLRARLAARLEAAGSRVLWPRTLPPGDGGLSAGQAAVAACRANPPQRS